MGGGCVLTQHEIEQLLSLIPIFLIGILVGISSYLTQETEAKKTFKYLLKQVLLSVSLCLIVFSLLSISELPYLAKIGISCAFGFFGIDKALDIVKNILNLKGGK